MSGIKDAADPGQQRQCPGVVADWRVCGGSEWGQQGQQISFEVRHCRSRHGVFRHGVFLAPRSVVLLQDFTAIQADIVAEKRPLFLKIPPWVGLRNSIRQQRRQHHAELQQLKFSDPRLSLSGQYSVITQKRGFHWRNHSVSGLKTGLQSCLRWPGFCSCRRHGPVRQLRCNQTCHS